jgi:two-component system, cell cycle sensor histidine kinase and response regulator CckA
LDRADASKGPDESAFGSEGRLRQIGPGSALIVVLDDHGCVEQVNAAVEVATGDRLEAIAGRDWCECLLPPEDRPRFLTQFDALRAGRPDDFVGTCKLAARPGDVRLIQWQISPIRKAGEFLGAILVGLDAGVSMPVELALRASEEQLHRILSAVEQSPVSVIITDTDGCIEYVNPKLTEVSGFSREDLVGETTSMLESGEMPRAEYSALWDTIRSGKEWKGELHTKTKSGELRWQHTTISPIKNDQGEITHFVAIMEDVTLRKSLEQQLHQAQKMEALGTLVGGIAHDFNNLLTAINGYSAVILSKLDAVDPMRREMEEIKKAGDRAAGLTRQLLAFGRKQVLRPKVLDLNEVLAGIHELIAGLIRDQIELVTCLQPNLGRVKADPGQIEQVILNVVINARDAMPQGGKLVLLTADVNVEPADMLKHPGMKSGPYILLAVSDTGCGMNPETLTHIFEPFFTTKEVGKGTGLGLSTAYGIIKQSGGYIYASSQPGKGSTFEIYLPREETGSRQSGRVP